MSMGRWRPNDRPGELDRRIILQLDRLEAQLNRMEHTMTDVQSDQQHEDTNITAIGAAVGTIIAELKASAAAGTPLNFAAGDALVQSLTAEAVADAPSVPPVPPVV